MDNIEQRIRERAHEIWEQEGRPTGREEEFQARAALELGLKLGGEEPAGERHTEKPADDGHINVVAGDTTGLSQGGSPVSALPGNLAQQDSPYASTDPRTERTG